jgi:hypothetical protein
MMEFLSKLAEIGGPSVVISIVILLILKVTMKKQSVTSNGQGAQMVTILDRLAANSEREIEILRDMKELHVENGKRLGGIHENLTLAMERQKIQMKDTESIKSSVTRNKRRS